jgi:hypothetical protein
VACTNAVRAAHGMPKGGLATPCLTLQYGAHSALQISLQSLRVIFQSGFVALAPKIAHPFRAREGLTTTLNNKRFIMATAKKAPTTAKKTTKAEVPAAVATAPAAKKAASTSKKPPP